MKPCFAFLYTGVNFGWHLHGYCFLWSNIFLIKRFLCGFISAAGITLILFLDGNKNDLTLVTVTLLGGCTYVVQYYIYI